MTKQEYNGWTNYETWAMKLWMNAALSEVNWHEIAESLIESAKETEAA